MNDSTHPRWTRVALRVVLSCMLAGAAQPGFCLDLRLRSDVGKKSQFLDRKYRQTNRQVSTTPTKPKASETRGRAGDLRSMRRRAQSKERTANQMHRVGWAHLEAGRLDQAMKVFADLAKLDHSDSYAWNNLGVVYARMGRWEDAVFAYREARKRDPRADYIRKNLISALRWVGYKHSNNGDYIGAIKAYNDVLKIDSRNADTWNSLGHVYGKMHLREQSREAYEKALQLNPGFQIARENLASAWNNIGIDLARQGRHGEAIRAYQRALELDPSLDIAGGNLANAWSRQGYKMWVEGDFGQAALAYRQATEVDPGNATAWQNLGNMLDRLGHQESAVEAYGRALRLSPRDPKVREGMARAWRKLAEQQARQGRHDAAFGSFNRALEMDSGDGRIRKSVVEALNNLACDRSGEGDFEGARRLLEQALEFDPDDEMVKRNLEGIKAYVLKERFEREWADSQSGRRSDYLNADSPSTLEEGEEFFRDGMKRFSDNRKWRTLLSSNLSRQYDLATEAGDYQVRIRAARALVELDPGNGDYRKMLGRALIEKGDIEEGKQVFRKAAMLAPGDISVYFNLAESLITADDPEGAILAFQDGIERIPPGNPEQVVRAQLAVADLYARQLGDSKSALEAAIASTRAMPESGQLQVAVASFAFAAGKTAVARTAVERSIAMEPQSPFVQAFHGLWLQGEDDASGAQDAFRLAFNNLLLYERDSFYRDYSIMEYVEDTLREQYVPGQKKLVRQRLVTKDYEGAYRALRPVKFLSPDAPETHRLQAELAKHTPEVSGKILEDLIGELGQDSGKPEAAPEVSDSPEIRKLERKRDSAEVERAKWDVAITEFQTRTGAHAMTPGERETMRELTEKRDRAALQVKTYNRIIELKNDSPGSKE